MRVELLVAVIWHSPITQESQLLSSFRRRTASDEFLSFTFLGLLSQADKRLRSDSLTLNRCKHSHIGKAHTKRFHCF